MLIIRCRYSMELLCTSVIKDVEQLGWVYGIKSNRIMNANDIEIIING
jgi:hypothetical protein